MFFSSSKEYFNFCKKMYKSFGQITIFRLWLLEGLVHFELLEIVVLLVARLLHIVVPIVDGLVGSDVLQSGVGVGSGGTSDVIRFDLAILRLLVKKFFAAIAAGMYFSKHWLFYNKCKNLKTHLLVFCISIMIIVRYNISDQFVSVYFTRLT